MSIDGTLLVNRSKISYVFLAILFLAFIVISCSDNPSGNPNKPEPDPKPEPSPESPVGSLEITTITTGLDPNPKGYTIEVNDVDDFQMNANAKTTSEKIEEGSYSVELSSVEDHCTVQSENPVSVDIVAEETTQVEFDVECKGIFRNKIVFFRSQSQAKSANSMAMQSYFTMNPDGSDIEQAIEFSLDGRIYMDSDLSPDGTKMVVSYSENPRDTYPKSRLAIMNAYDNELIFITNPSGNGSHSTPVFSPDGTKIAFIQVSDSYRKRDIYVVNTDGSNMMQITSSDAHESTLDWSPDGSKIVFERSSKDYTYMGIYMINSDGTGEKIITDSDLEFSDPSWSPNGDKIAVIGSKTESYYYEDVYVMDSDGSNVQFLTSKKGQSIYYSTPTWSSDGSKLAFISNRDGEEDEEYGYAYEPQDIFIINADGSNLMNLTNTMDTTESNLMWSSVSN